MYICPELDFGILATPIGLLKQASAGKNSLYGPFPEGKVCGGHLRRGSKRCRGVKKSNFFLFPQNVPGGPPKPIGGRITRFWRFSAPKTSLQKQSFFQKLCQFTDLSQTVHPRRHLHAHRLQNSCESVVKSVFLGPYRYRGGNPHLGIVSSTQRSEKVSRNHFPQNSFFSFLYLAPLDGHKRVPWMGIA